MSAGRRTTRAVLGGLALAAAAVGMSGPAAAQASETGMRESLRLLDLPAPWLVVLVILPSLALISWLGYRGENLSSGARMLLSGLRFCALTILLIVLFRPVLVQRREEVQKAEVIVLVDDSASMRRKDAYGGDPARRKALSSLAPRALDDTSRLELADSVLRRELLPRLVEEEYVPRVFTFGADLSPMSVGNVGTVGNPGNDDKGSGELTGRGHATYLGDALAQVLAAHRGRHVTDVVILSDGKQNGGGPAQDAARSAALAGIPVHTIVIGDTRPERNAVVELVEAPGNALEGDEVAITVRVLGRGTGGEERAQVRLEEYEANAPGGSQPHRRVVAEEDVRLTESGERVTLIARPGQPDRRTGDRRFRVEITPLRDETLLDDNNLEVSVHVTPEKVRVLYVEGYPRWEYRRLALDMLKRSDENIEFQAFLLSATRDFLQESSRGLPHLTEVPTDRKALLDGYDVVILGDVNPYMISPDPARAEEFMKSLVEFVERGGGLLFIAGEYDNPRAYVSTPLEPLMPVVLDLSEMMSTSIDTTREFHPHLEDPANPHEIVRLIPEVDVNRRLWEESEGLSGMYWFLPVTRAKPGAQVLARHPTDGNGYGKYPLLVSGYYPSGRTLFVSVDETWRWQFRYGHRYHERFWRNAIRWLALGRLKSGDRRYRVELARNTYNLGERVTVEARVLDEDYRPSQEPERDVLWNEPDGRPTQLTLIGVPGRQGVYRGSLESERPGLHRVWIEVAGNRIASAEFEVVLPSLENQDPAPDPDLLREVSVLSAGRALDPTRLGELWPEFEGGEERREPISSRLDDVWDTWGTLLAALAVLALEWILRKRMDLV